jgi:hypothetical protein
MTGYRNIQKSGIVIILCFVLVLAAIAQDATFTASVDRNKIGMGEQFEITFMLSGSGGGSNFRPPAFNEFLTLSGPNQSTNMQFINGATSMSVSYTYILQPRAEGKFVIAPAFITHNNKQLQTQPVTIEVTKGAPPQKQQSKQSQQDADIGKQIGENLFLKVVVDKARVYQGEQITATYKIFTRVNVVNYNLTKMPSITGFWSEDLEIPKQIQLSNEVVNGKQYRVGILKKAALFPQRSGTLTLDPMEVECAVQVQSRRRSNDVFDQFFNDPFFGNVTNVNHKVRSQPVNITVLPLPSTDIPIAFNGAVGKYSMEVWLDKKETKTNEPVTLKVKISGRGNLKLLEAPPVSVSPDIEKYDPKISDNVTKENDRISGSRTFEYLLIPRHPGEQKIPSFQFSYFDVEKKNYVSLNSQEFTVTVAKGSETSQTYATGISKEDVKLLGEDIRFIKSGNVSYNRRGEAFAGSVIFFILSVSPVIAFFGFIFYARRREKFMGNLMLVRNRTARKVARKRLSDAKKFLDTKKKEDFYTEISRALWGYIGDKLGIPPADLSIDLIRNSLESKKLSVGMIAKLVSTIESCEYARFAPTSDSVTMDSVYRETVELISAIEEELR